MILIEMQKHECYINIFMVTNTNREAENRIVKCFSFLKIQVFVNFSC